MDIVKTFFVFLVFYYTFALSFNLKNYGRY